MSVLKEYTGTKPYLKTFDAEHGGISVKNGEYHLYPNGAYRCGDEYGGPRSTDPIDLQKAAVRFWSLAVENAASEFYRYKDRVAVHNHGDPSVVETLEDMHREVKTVRKQLKGAELELLRLQTGASTVEEAKKIHKENERRKAEYASEQAQAEAESLNRVMRLRI